MVRVSGGGARPPGRVRTVLGTDPAANTEISETVPAGRRWKILAVFFRLVTDANAANRIIHLIFDDGTNTIADIGSYLTQTASQTRDYDSFPGAGDQSSAADGTARLNFPHEIILEAGSRIRTTTTARQATDNYGPPSIHIEEWFT